MKLLGFGIQFNVSGSRTHTILLELIDDYDDGDKKQGDDSVR